MATSVRPPQPAEIVHSCDTCHRTGKYLTECSVCGGDYCLTCAGIVPGSYGFTKLCRSCAKRDDVWEICQEHATRLSVIYQQRDAELAGLPERDEAV